MASSSKIDAYIDHNNSSSDTSTLTDTASDRDTTNKHNNTSAKTQPSDNESKAKDGEGEELQSVKKGRKLKSKKRRRPKRRDTSSLDRTNSIDTVSEKSVLSTDSKKLRKRRPRQQVNKFFVDPNGAIERKLEEKYVELEELLNRQFVERKTNLTHLHIGQMEVLRQQYNLSCHGLPPAGVTPYSHGPRRRPHSAHHAPAWDGESDEAYSAIRQIQQMSKYPQRRKIRSKSAKSRREINSDTETNRHRRIDINSETASLSSARSPRSRRKRVDDSSSDRRSRRSPHSRESTSPSISPSRGYIPTDNQLKNTEDRRIREWLRKKNKELKKHRSIERAEKKVKRQESILKENEKIIAREAGRSKVEEWMNRKKREAIEQKKAERLRHRQLEEEQKEREAKKKMNLVQGKSWKRPASAPAFRSKNKSALSSSTDDPSTSNDGETIRPVPHPPNSKLIYKRRSAGRVRLKAKPNENVEASDSRPPTEKSLEASQLSYSEWLERKRKQDAEKKKAEAEAKASEKKDSDLNNLLPELHKNRVSKVLKSKKRVDSGLRNGDDGQTSEDPDTSTDTFLAVSGSKAEMSSRYSFPRPQSAKLPSPQPCKSPKRPKSAHPRVDSILAEEKEEPDENPFHLPFPAHLGVPKEVAKTQSKVFPDRVAAERQSIEVEESSQQESNGLAIQQVDDPAAAEQTQEDIQVEESTEESPRVGASFFTTQDSEPTTPVAAETNDAPGKTQQSFLEINTQKQEPDKENEAPENANNNNNNLSDANQRSEVNVTELPSEKIPTLGMGVSQANESTYKQDLFATDSETEESANEDIEEDEHENDIQTLLREESNTADGDAATGSDQVQEQKVVDESQDIPVEEGTPDVQIVEDPIPREETEDNRHADETTKVEQMVDQAQESMNEMTDQKADDTLQSKMSQEDQQEEPKEDIPGDSTQVADQSFLESGQAKHEPDKSESEKSILEQVMETLPSSEDDSRGETSSLDDSAKPSLIDGSGSVQEEVSNNMDDDAKQTEEQEENFQEQTTASTDPGETVDVDSPEATEETNVADGPSETTQEVQTFIDTEKNLESQGQQLTQNTSAKSQTICQPTSGDSSAVIEPQTPRLGRHLSSEELLTNIQAGKKLISIPDDSDSTSTPDPDKAEDFALEKDSQDDIEQTENAENLGQVEGNKPNFGPSSENADAMAATPSNEVTVGKDDETLIEDQQLLKQTTLNEIQELQSFSSDKGETENADTVKINDALPESNENTSDAQVISDQEMLKEQSIDELLNSENRYEPLDGPIDDTESEIEENIQNEFENNSSTQEQEPVGKDDDHLQQSLENNSTQEDKSSLLEPETSVIAANTTEFSQTVKESDPDRPVQDQTSEQISEVPIVEQSDETEHLSDSNAKSKEQSVDPFIASQTCDLPIHQATSSETPDEVEDEDVQKPDFQDREQDVEVEGLDDLQKRLERLRSSEDFGSSVAEVRNGRQEHSAPDENEQKREEPSPSVPSDETQRQNIENGRVELDEQSLTTPEVSDTGTESDSNSDDFNNNKMVLQNDNQKFLENNSEQVTESSVTRGVTNNKEETALNSENELNLFPDNRRNDTPDINENLKPTLSQSRRDDTSVNDSPTSSPQKKVSFSQNPIIIHEDDSMTSTRREVDSDSDAVDELMRTMI